MNTSGRSTCAVYAVISCLLWFIGLGLSACNSSDSGVESPAPVPGSPSSTPPVTPPPGAIASITINSPTQSATLAPGPVLVTFDIQNSPVAPSTAQPRMHFYIDSDPTVYTFYDGPGVMEDGALSGVRYQNVHTHFVHWKSGNSIHLNALASGSHQLRFVLVDDSEVELTSTQTVLVFTIAAGNAGEFSLQQVVGNLNVPVSLATAPDGRIFVSELATGNIRVVTPTTTLPWQLQAAPFAHLDVFSGGEHGLLGIAVDPNFNANGFVYVFYTPFGLPNNRVARFVATTVNGNTVATNPAPTIIFDNIPTASIHNGGIIQFGPDGMLYIVVGENNVPADAQNLNSLRGKFLRIRPDGSIPSDNPFAATLSPPYSAIYSYGHRNSFGFAFHPHTGDLWETENGESLFDEINRILPAQNYGWPFVEGTGTDPALVNPLITFGPPIAPTGITMIREDSVYPAQYHNNLLFADFNIGNLRRIVLGGAGLTNLVSQNIACNCGLGPLFGIMHGLNVPGQDGYVYVTSGSGIFRVVLSNP